MKKLTYEVFASFIFMLASCTAIGMLDEDSGKASRVLAPVFDPPAGLYSVAQNIVMSTSTTGAKIYYTTDDSVPSISSIEYFSPISVHNTTTVKAIAIKSGLENSPVSSAIYTINNGSGGGDDGFPVIYPYASEGVWVYTFEVSKHTETSYGTTSESEDGVVRVKLVEADSMTGICRFAVDGKHSNLVMNFPSVFTTRIDGEKLEVQLGSDSSWWTLCSGNDVPFSDGVFLFIPNIVGATPFTVTATISSLGQNANGYRTSASYNDLSNQYTAKHRKAESSQTFIPGIGLANSSWAFFLDDESDTFYYILDNESCSVTLSGYSIIEEDGTLLTAGKVDYSGESPTGAPTELVAVSTSVTNIRLDWTDNSINENYFIIERKPTSSETYQTIASVEADSISYLDDSVAADEMEYSYRVYATNANGVSSVSNESASHLVVLPSAPQLTEASWGNVFNSFGRFQYQWVAISLSGIENVDSVIVEGTAHGTENWEILCTIDEPSDGRWQIWTGDYFGDEFGTWNVDLRAKAENMWGSSSFSVVYNADL